MACNHIPCQYASTGFCWPPLPASPNCGPSRLVTTQQAGSAHHTCCKQAGHKAMLSHTVSEFWDRIPLATLAVSARQDASKQATMALRATALSMVTRSLIVRMLAGPWWHGR